MMLLYSYWRSTTSYRVRIALALKGLDYEYRPINLIASEHEKPCFEALNPIKGVPTLVLKDGSILTQSMAILDYLDNVKPDPALLPTDNPVLRARILAAAMIFATEVHPLNNLKVINQLKVITASDVKVEWMRHWMIKGFQAFNKLILPNSTFSFGDAPSLADICLVAQLYNAHRWGVDLSATSHLLEIEKNCLALPAFQDAHPEKQMDAK